MADNLADKTKSSELNVLATARAVRATWIIIGITGIWYPLQFYFFIISLLGLGGLIAVDTTVLGWFDFFGIFSGGAFGVYLLGMAVNSSLAILGFIIANGVFIISRVNCWNKSFSLIIAAVCLALSFIPILSFIPWLWLWLLYVTKSQTRN